MVVLIDVSRVSDECCNHAIDELFAKAAGDPPDIWSPHHSPLVRRLIELFTERGLMRIGALQLELQKWLDGERHKESERSIVPPGYVERWTPGELELVRLYLESLPPAEFTADDWMLCIDFLHQRYFPQDELRAEAEWLAVRASIMGRVQARMGEVSERQADALLMASPATVEEVGARFGMNAAQSAMLRWGRTHCAENIVTVADGIRQRVKAVVLDYQRGMALGDPTIRETLQTRLADKFAAANTDWRRIAVTEAGELQLQGLIASLPPGARLRRLEQYKGACPFCRKINGMEVTVVSPDDPNRDPWETVWVGKNNVGRSAAPRKRVNGELIDRDDAEMWWMPAGLAHPHCFVDPRVPIYTQEGWRPISSIKVGDMVLTHAGRFRPVNWVLDGVKHTGNIVSIKVSFAGRNKTAIPQMTPEHPVMTGRGWVAAGDIVPGDTIRALAKVCPTCGDTFVNPKFDHVNYCCMKCRPVSGKNQFSTDDPEKLVAAIEQTRKASIERMRGMTIEQRRALTAAGRSVMQARGYEHLSTDAGRRKGSIKAASHNYTPTPEELDIAEMLDCLGIGVELQHRVPANAKDARGYSRYWWLDIALPEQKIAVEIDGEPWHGRLMEDGRDARRDADLAESGWTVLRFSQQQAKFEPFKIAEAVARLAMNHSGQYQFSELTVEAVNSSRKVRDRTLYNFGVEEDESYIIKGGVVVHNCRGTWLELKGPDSAGDPDFTAWMASVLEKK